MIALTRRVSPDHEEDVARFGAILAANGYSAHPVDIEAAYAAWSLSVPRNAWHPAGYLNDQQILESLLKHLEPSEPSEAPPEAPPVASEEPAHADELPQQDADRRDQGQAATERDNERRPDRPLPNVRHDRPPDRGRRQNRR